MDLSNISKASIQTSERVKRDRQKTNSTIYNSFAPQMRKEVDLSGEKSLIKE